jgi:hypothetical protein
LDSCLEQGKERSPAAILYPNIYIHTVFDNVGYNEAASKAVAGLLESLNYPIP